MKRLVMLFLFLTACEPRVYRDQPTEQEKNVILKWNEEQIFYFDTCRKNRIKIAYGDPIPDCIQATIDHFGQQPHLSGNNSVLNTAVGAAFGTAIGYGAFKLLFGK